MRARLPGPAVLALLLAISPLSASARGIDAAVLASVVSVLPLWPGHEQGGLGNLPPGAEPEGSAVAVAPDGYLATALHVVAPASEIWVRLADGRVLPAELVARDPATDVALLKVEAAVPPLPFAPEPGLGEAVCAVGNAFGLDLSVTCGVVSAVRRSGVGFNPIEDFIQTDASVNPGASGGALVDREGRLVGLLSAIFTKQSDADIGVNFAVSAAMLQRILPDLIEHGQVLRSGPGLRVVPLERGERTELSGARILAVNPGSAAEAAGLKAGQVLQRVDGRRIGSQQDLTAAVQLRRPGETLLFEGLGDDGPFALEVTLPAARTPGGGTAQ